MNLRTIDRGQPETRTCPHFSLYNVDDDFYCDQCEARFDLVPDPPIQEFPTP